MFAATALVKEVRIDPWVIILPAAIGLFCLIGGVWLLRSRDNRQHVLIWILASLLLLVALGIGACYAIFLVGG
jgi:hypothetical protein